MATAIVIGTVIGSGVFKKPSAVARDVPEFGLAIAAWVLVGILALMGALVLAEIAVLLPRAGGNYVFLREAYGRWAGFLWGWVEFWIIRTSSIAALATIFVESLHDVLRQGLDLPSNQEALTFWQRQLMVIGVIAVLALVNMRGTTLGGGLQVVVTTVKVASLVCIALLPFVFLSGLATPVIAGASFDNLDPVWPSDWGAVDWSKFGGALVACLWAYHGWMNIAPVAEEVRNPHRNIPLALLVGSLTVMAVYVSANFAYYLVVPSAQMPLLPRPVAAEFGLRLLGSIGLLLASTAIMISVFGSLNGNLLVGPRLLFAMGRDGMAPRFLSGLHSRWNTPAWAITILACWSILLVVGTAMLVRFGLPVVTIADVVIDLNLPPRADPFDVLTNFCIFGATAFETLAVASIFILRHRPVAGGEPPYRCPLYPLLPLVYVLAMGAVLVNMFVTSRTEAFVGVGFMIVGAFVYATLFAGRPPAAPADAGLEEVGSNPY